VSKSWTADDAAVTAGQALARLGLGERELQLLRLGENALYRVMDTDLLLRVTRAGTTLKEVARTVAAAATLRAHGVPVCEPVGQYEPMVLGDGVVSVWRFYTERPDSQSNFADFGRVIRRLHENSHELVPVLPAWNPFDKIYRRLRVAAAAGVPSEWVSDLTGRAGDLEKVLADFEPALSEGVIHGDAHAGNLINSMDGPILIDLDDLANGPRDADFVPTLVQLRRFGLATERWLDFTSGYGLADPWILHNSPLVRLRELFMLAWLLQQYGNSAAVDQEIGLRVGSLDEPADNLTRWSAR
jgi:Ser/Thr protein kinase RdoA (MazF antagonist)